MEASTPMVARLARAMMTIVMMKIAGWHRASLWGWQSADVQESVEPFRETTRP